MIPGRAPFWPRLPREVKGMTHEQPGDEAITRLLAAWRDGDRDAFSRAMPHLFDHLHRMAQRLFLAEKKDHTLQPTALINEAYLRLQATRDMTFQNRTHFVQFAGQIMRRILIDHARAKLTDKRGKGETPVPIEAAPPVPEITRLDPATCLAIEQALAQLEDVDPNQVRLIEMRFFLGMNLDEIAEMRGVSKSTLSREWQIARRWLARHLASSEGT
ncbi:Sigma-70 family RNA polymerase sigma factor [Sulfidibacter corallicola]